jgi:hypothetical protein
MSEVIDERQAGSIRLRALPGSHVCNANIYALITYALSYQRKIARSSDPANRFLINGEEEDYCEGEECVSLAFF